jgi:alpha-ketoglutarate-dependent taurine dioxygenase
MEKTSEHSEVRTARSGAMSNSLTPTINRSDPRAWTAGTLDGHEAWYFPLPHSCLSALDEVIRRLPQPVTELRLPDALRPSLEEAFTPVLTELERGRGFVILEGLDPERYPDEEARAVYWLVGQVLGEPFAQNVQGTLLYDVRDTGQDVSQGARFSVTNAESTFHTDNGFGEVVLDYAGLLCLRTARAGGVNQLVSGYAACEELRRNHPDALEILSQPFHFDRRGGVREGEAPTRPVPIIEWTAGGLLIRYLRYWIEVGHEKIGHPLTPDQVRAMDVLDGILQRRELRAEFALQPGQMLFFNNRWLLHNRTAFEDHPEVERRRHYVRLWLHARPLQVAG